MKKPIFFLLYILALSLILFLPSNVLADTCSTEIQNIYYNKINNIKYKINYVSDNNYSITFYGIPQDITIYDEYGTPFVSNDSNECTNGKYEATKTYKFIYKIDNLDCNLDFNTFKYIYITKFNVYSQSEECQLQENKNFKLCSETYQGKITDEIFDTELKKYQEENNKIETEEETKVNNTNSNINLYIIIFLLILSIMILTIIIIKKRRSSGYYDKRV